MPHGFPDFAESEGSATEFFSLFWERRRFIALVCAVAVGIAGLAAVVLPRRYTAISRIVIDPPAGTDPRASTAVSPIYLESLRTYELFASSDDLFFRAARKFGLRGSGQPMERLKKSVLKVGVPRNTKVLEISVDWRDPNIAHQLALYLADETVKLSQSIGRAGDEQLIREAEAQAAEAGNHLREAEKAFAAAAQKGSPDQIKAEIEADEQLRSMVRQRLIASDEEADRYRAQLGSLDREIAARAQRLAELGAELSSLEAQRTNAQAVFKSASARLAEIKLAGGYRGERLRLLDPGIIPERPSYPDVPLLLAAASFAGLVLALFVVVMDAGRARTVPAAPSLRVAGRR